MKKFALIVAGGTGSRMKGVVPKQFLELKGKPILMHTFDCFLSFDAEIEFVLVLPQDQKAKWDKLCKQFQFNTKYKLAYGGENRFQSVKNGLNLIRGKGIVFIHDGVRPLVSKQTIQNCYHTAIEKGNALPVIPLSESLRCISQQKNKAVDRSQYVLVQTPQTFRVDEIKKAYEQKYSNLFTDDASVLESMGKTINLVEGNRNNIKITFQEDLVSAGLFLHPQ